jgi:hypothetical protein
VRAARTSPRGRLDAARAPRGPLTAGALPLIAAALLLGAGASAALASGEAPRVALAIGDPALKTAVDDALVDVKIVPARSEAIAAEEAAALLSDDGAAAARAKALAEQGTAELLVLGALAFPEERTTEMGTSTHAEATLIVVSGRSGQRMTRVVRREKGAAADKERAKRKATDLASRAAAKALAEDLVGILARPQELSITVEVRGVTPEARARLGDSLEQAIARAGLTLGARRLDIASSVWRIEGRTTAATQDEVERSLRRAFTAAGLIDALRLTDAPPGAFVYDYRDTYRQIALIVYGVDADSQRAAGVEVAEALGKVPGIEAVDRAFVDAERSMALKFRTALRLSDIDAAILARREGPLGALTLLQMLSGDVLHYKLNKPVQSYVVEIQAIESRNVANVGVKIDAAVKTVAGYVSHERAQDPAQGLVKLTITFQGKPWELEKRLLEALGAVPELPQLMAVVPSKGSDLAYRAALSLNVAIRVRVTQVTPEVYRQSGLKLVDLIAAIEGVRFIDRKYVPEDEMIELAVEGSLDPIDLDMRIWKAIRGVPELAKLAPGETSGAALGYLFLSSNPEDWGATVIVSQLAAEAYAADGRLLIEVIRGMAGVKKVESNYDKDARELRISLRYPRPAHDLEEAIWKALEGRTFSKAFSPDRRVGSVIHIAFVERRGDRSRAFVRVDGIRDDAARAAARRLLERVRGIEGVAEVTAEEAGDRLEIALWSRLTPSQLYDAVAAAIAEDKALAPLTDGGLEGNVVVVRGGPGASVRRGIALGTGAGGAGGGRLSDLVERLMPSVVYIEGKLPNGASWLGTGFFVSARGHILTNQHVAGPPSPQFAQESVRLTVRTRDGRVLQAQHIDGNATTDVALLKVAGEGFAAVEVGDSDLVKAGDGLIVIGHPHGLDFSVTTGVVSALDRAKGRIQSSVNTHPGNSGGPVFDESGRVIAIHVAGAMDRLEVGGNEMFVKRPGVNFHIPINVAIPYLQIAGAAPRGVGR